MLDKVRENVKKEVSESVKKEVRKSSNASPNVWASGVVPSTWALPSAPAPPDFNVEPDRRKASPAPRPLVPRSILAL